MNKGYFFHDEEFCVELRGGEAVHKVSFFGILKEVIELAGLLVFDIVSSAISKEVGTWEVDLKSSVGFGSNFTLS